MKKVILTVIGFFLLFGCSDSSLESPVKQTAGMSEASGSSILMSLPPAQHKVNVVLNGFEDKTAQYAQEDNTTGNRKLGLSMLSRALSDAGNNSWFMLTEHGNSKKPTHGRGNSRGKNGQYAQASEPNASGMNPLLRAGILLDAGIIAHESDARSGGAGAKWLGLRNDSTYRRDKVTVYLRATSIHTAETLLSANTSKTLYSIPLQTGAYRYVSLNHLLKLESGTLSSAPEQLAVKQAIEMAVYSMVIEGAAQKLWGFANTQAGAQTIENYNKIKSSAMTLDNILEKESSPLAKTPHQGAVSDADDSTYNAQEAELIRQLNRDSAPTVKAPAAPATKTKRKPRPSTPSPQQENNQVDKLLRELL